MFFIFMFLLSWRPVKMSQKEGFTASNLISDVILQFHSDSVLTNAFHGGCIFFFSNFVLIYILLVCIQYMAFSCMHVCLNVWWSFFGPESNALLLKGRGWGKQHFVLLVESNDWKILLLIFARRPFIKLQKRSTERLMKSGQTPTARGVGNCISPADSRDNNSKPRPGGRGSNNNNN